MEGQRVVTSGNRSRSTVFSDLSCQTSPVGEERVSSRPVTTTHIDFRTSESCVGT